MFDCATGGGDVLRGGAGDDQLYGGVRRFAMEGDAQGGDDVLDGGDGDDALNGDAPGTAGAARGGGDALTGSAGADRFHFAGSFGGDLATDFSGSADEGDTLVFIGYAESDLTVASLSAGVTLITVGNGDAQVTVLGGPVGPGDIVFA